MNPKLIEAVTIFKELGWEEVTPENVMELPLGTAEQRKVALAGLKSGEWRKWEKRENGGWGDISLVDVEEFKLALFAVRIGVDAKRATHIIFPREREEMVVAVIAARGTKYAMDFISHACTANHRPYENATTYFGNVAVRLVYQLSLEVPRTVDYMKDWSVYAAAALGLKVELPRIDRDRYESNLPNIEMIKQRFGEHTQVGVSVNTPATGPFGRVLPAGVARGWLARELALPLVFSALDLAVRPGDRKVWLQVLDELAVKDEELHERIQALIPLVASGDTTIVKRLAPLFIANESDEMLTEVLLASFSATAKSAKQLVLKSALKRPCPENTAELSAWLSLMAKDKDKSIASLAERLMQQWCIDDDNSLTEPHVVQGLWQETPPVWKVPPFELGEVSPEALTDLAAGLVKHPEVIHDIVGERFLAMANAVAYEDPQAARLSLQGLREDFKSILRFVVDWVQENIVYYESDQLQQFYVQRLLDAPLEARDHMVSLSLDKLPCLLSTPSLVDLSIHCSDLIERITLYQKVGVDILEADLFLALTRLDVNTATTEEKDELARLDVPIVLHSGERMSNTAGQVVLAYLRNPTPEPTLELDEYGYGYGRWERGTIKTPSALAEFSQRSDAYKLKELYAIFPHWGDCALLDVHWRDYVYHEKGLAMRQIARRATNLPPGGAMNFLAAQRSSTSHAEEDSALAILEAWERGLLRPGIASVTFLDWNTKPPSHLAALATAFEVIAGDGLLSVVWPILDDLVTESIKAPRLPAGTTEVVQVISAMLPEVMDAIERGVAEKNALDLPGTRELARRSGSSKAVIAAKEVISKVDIYFSMV